jgi:hypothetical protein
MRAAFNPFSLLLIARTPGEAIRELGDIIEKPVSIGQFIKAMHDLITPWRNLLRRVVKCRPIGPCQFP